MQNTSLLSAAQLEEELVRLPGWVNDGKSLSKDFTQKDFKSAIRYVNDVAHIANAVDHHPDMAISGNKVTVKTSSHDAGGVTQRDIDLARRIEAIS